MTTGWVPDDRQDDDTKGHRLASNDNETIVADETRQDDRQDDDTEAHRLASNDNETIVADGASGAQRPSSR